MPPAPSDVEAGGWCARYTAAAAAVVVGESSGCAGTIVSMIRTGDVERNGRLLPLPPY